MSLRSITSTNYPARRRLGGWCMQCALSVLAAMTQALSAQGPAATRSPGPPLQGANARPGVTISHVAVPLDSVTFQAMVTSPFLRTEFGGFENRPALPGAPRPSFLYYGRDNYLEFLGLDTAFPVGSAQLAFVVEQSGGLHRVVDNLLVERPRVIAYSVAFRQLGAESVPLFYRARIRPAILPSQQVTNGPRPYLRADIIERHPAFLHRDDPTTPSDSVGITQAEYLTRRWKPGTYLRSVVGVTYAGDSAEVIALAGDLSALGYELRQAADTIIALRPGFMLNLLPATTERRGVVAVRIATQRPKAGQKVYRFGPRSILRFEDGNTASWTF